MDALNRFARSTLLALSLFAVTAINSSANMILTVDKIANQEIARFSGTLNLIDWKIGDYQDYKVTIGGFGLEGTMHKEVFGEEGNGVWVRQDLNLTIQRDKTEVLYDRETGKVLKLVRNGKEEKLPDSDIELIDQKRETIEVPAGKFDVMHITAKSKDVKQIDVWMNPRKISLDGAAKMAMQQESIQITMVLTKFKKN